LKMRVQEPILKSGERPCLAQYFVHAQAGVHEFLDLLRSFHSILVGKSYG
jgi:hypothetical protein